MIQNKKIQNKNQKKSQLKIGETIMVMVIFFILLVIGIIFYAKVQQHLSKIDEEEYLAKRAKDMAMSVSFLPELQCTKTGTEDFDCIDKVKLESFQKIVPGSVYSRYYKNLFSNSKISVHEIYSTSPLAEPVELFESVIDKSAVKGSQLIFIPVTIYDPRTEISSYGYIKLEVYG